MAKFTAKVVDLKKAVSISPLATSEVADTEKGHALFEISGDKAIIRSTDDDRISFTWFPVEESDGDCKFTANPKDVLALIGTSDRDKIKFEYEPDKKTLNLYASEDEDAFVSFPSFDPVGFLSFDEHLKTVTDIDLINTSMLTTALKFEQGFIAQDDRNQKFSNLYVSEGVMYSTNGSNRVGAFKAEDLSKIFLLTVRRQMISPILSFIDRMGIDSVAIKENDKMVIFMTTDTLSGFGFRKSTVEMPKIPLKVEVPNGTGINIDKAAMLKKISRLAVAMQGENMTLEMSVEDTTLTIKTMTERKSVEKMPCKRISGEGPIRFLIDCQMLKNILSLFQAPNVDLYLVAKNRCILYNEADMLIDEKDKKQFTAVGLISLPREV